MAAHLVVVPDVFLPDGTVRRGELPEPDQEFGRALARIMVKINRGMMTIDEARALMGFKLALSCGRSSRNRSQATFGQGVPGLSHERSPRRGA